MTFGTCSQYKKRYSILSTFVFKTHLGHIGNKEKSNIISKINNIDISVKEEYYLHKFRGYDANLKQFF